MYDKSKVELIKYCGNPMPPFLQFLICRLLAIPISFLIITMLLYAGVMMTPPELRAELYFPNTNAPLTDIQRAHIIQNIIVKYHLRDPYPIQYALWLKSIFQGEWGYSPTLAQNVLPALIQRMPATAELTIYSILFFVTVGLVSGVLAGWKQNRAFDNTFRFFAFVATSFPPFILAILLLAIFYVNLHWFAPGRIDMMFHFQMIDSGFRTFTGLLTIELFTEWAYRHISQFIAAFGYAGLYIEPIPLGYPGAHHAVDHHHGTS